MLHYKLTPNPIIQLTSPKTSKTQMAMVTSNGNTLLKAVKPFKTGWKVEIKVLHSWTQHSSYDGGDTLEFILADVTVVVFIIVVFGF